MLFTEWSHIMEYASFLEAPSFTNRRGDVQAKQFLSFTDGMPEGLFRPQR